MDVASPSSATARMCGAPSSSPRGECSPTLPRMRARPELSRTRDPERLRGSREAERERTMLPRPPRPVVSYSLGCGEDGSSGGLLRAVIFARPPRPVEWLKPASVSKTRAREKGYAHALAVGVAQTLFFLETCEVFRVDGAAVVEVSGAATA